MKNVFKSNGIEITVSQRVEAWPGYGRKFYFSKDCDVAISLDGNADNAQLIAGLTVSGAIQAHAGDTLLIAVKLHGELVARWVGVATAKAAGEFQGFIEGRMSDFEWTARRLADAARGEVAA